MPRPFDRGLDKQHPKQNDKIGLPYRPFLFTLDQISVLLSVEPKALERQYVYFEGRSIGSLSKSQMIARNIAPPDKEPEWRIAERELIRWMRMKGFRYYERGVTSN